MVSVAPSSAHFGESRPGTFTGRQRCASPPPLSASLDATLEAFAALPGADAVGALDGGQLLMERMLLTGAKVRSGSSPSGTCRFVTTTDATLAVNLPRTTDWELLPAWLEADTGVPWTWEALASALRLRSTQGLLERARLLGLAVAVPGRHGECGYSDTAEAQPTPGSRLRGRGRVPLVVDLSALWAGPLCAHLLWLCGARVIKVESIHRPDGARFGNSEFYALLNQGKRSVALDFTRSDGRRALGELLAVADMVIESSRPRALRQLGVEVERWLHQQDGRTWVSITGYGRDEPCANWIAYGDDAGVAAGLAEVMRAGTGSPQFAGDAIADPLTGAQAAHRAWANWLQGGSRLVALSLAGVARRMLAAECQNSDPDLVAQHFARWWQSARRGEATAAARHRTVCAPVAALGADTGDILHEFNS